MKYYFNKTIKGTFEEAIDKVTQGLKEEGFGILTEIDIKRHISKAGVIIFVAGVLIQEIVLMFQRLDAIEVEPLRYANMILFYAAIVTGAGLIWITVSMNGVS